MALGNAAATIISGAVSAYSSVSAGNAQGRSIQSQADYEARSSEQQAELVGRQKSVVDRRYDRLAGRTRGAGVAATAGKGFMLSGSPLAIMADIESQIEFDRAGDQYNLDLEKSGYLAQAERTRYEGGRDARSARTAGYTNAFSSALSTYDSYRSLNTKGPLTTKQSAAKAQQSRFSYRSGSRGAV